MGGCEIDLRKAGIAADPAVIDTFALWGGIEIYVPDDWEVVNRGFAVMGGFEDKTKRPVEPKGRLVVTGFALMGGVEISN
jgi:predicted membrane protein